MDILIKRKLGLHVLDKAWQLGKPPVQIRDNNKHPQNRGLKLVELLPEFLARKSRPFPGPRSVSVPL